MPFFILFSLILSYLTHTASPLQAILSSEIIVHVGITLAVSFMVLNHFKKLPQAISYDFFASSTLMVWFAYWKPLFNEDSPIFFFFPVYFALLTAFVTLVFSGHNQHLDYQTLQQMQKISDKSRLKPWLIMLSVLASLELQEHYLLFPVMMTLFILRFALSSCLERR